MGTGTSLCRSNAVTEEQELDVIPDEPRLLKSRRRSTNFAENPQAKLAYSKAVEMLLTCQGKVFKDHYKMVKFLGSGSYSHVTVGVHRQSKLKFAVKVIRKHGSEEEDDEQKQIVLRELAMALLLKDVEQAIRVHDVFEDDKYYYLVMAPCD